METAAYLTRIQYREPVKPDVETLHGLQRAHMLTVPFENLDIGLNRPIRLDLESLWNKLIIQRRGGFCYEVNGLFGWLLEQIGFEVTYLNARDYHPEDDSFGIDFDHLVLLVRVPNEPTRWLADVGWGDSFTQPLEPLIDISHVRVSASDVVRGVMEMTEPFLPGYAPDNSFGLLVPAGYGKEDRLNP